MKQFGLRREDICVTVNPCFTDNKPNGDVWLTLFNSLEFEMILELTPEDISDLVRALIYESERGSECYG
jgi:hypothetical protein